MTTQKLKVGIVAGELSGDILGAGLIRALQQHAPDLTVQGIGGPRMMAAGCQSWYPIELLSVMGLVEVLGRLPSLFQCRADLVQRFLADPPDVFIGIDAPDFTLGLERRLRAKGIPTAHYVSPSVWAWRESRVKKIAKSCDLMLTLLPFEAAFYESHNMAVQFVGHPLAAQVPLENDQQQARQQLGLDAQSEWLALLPGSRRTEVSKLTEPFLRTVQWLAEHRPGIKVIVPLANDKVRQVFSEQLTKIEGKLPTLVLVDGQSQTAMTAADLVLTASGTATLEAMLLKRPMVMAYKVAPMTYNIA
ncbi:MAG: lipid-A-disaccharide synthase, partial [Pseudomonadota bacterium]